MKIKFTTNLPQTQFDGWTGFITMPDGSRHSVVDYCGGAPCSFSTRKALDAAMTKRAQALAQAFLAAAKRREAA